MRSQGNPAFVRRRLPEAGGLGERRGGAMRAVRWVVGATAVMVVVAGVSLPATGVPAHPVPARALPAAVDVPASYDPEVACSSVAQPGSLALRDLLLATYGPATVYITRACASTTSEHFDGRAVDWMRSVRVPAQKAQVEALLSWLLAKGPDGTPHANARRLGVMYVIWNNKMIRMYDVGRGWTNYRSCQTAGNAGASMDTSCHRNHVHLSLSWDGAAKQTSWWTGAAQSLPNCPARTTKAKAGAGTARFVANPGAVTGVRAVTAVTALDTARGVGGGLTTGCRAIRGRILYANAHSAAVPKAARWAMVRVTALSNAPATVHAWSAGGTRPATGMAAGMGSSTGTALVPVASDGTIAVATTLGAARLLVQVVGYATGTPGVPAAALVPAPAPAPSPTAKPTAPAPSAKPAPVPVDATRPGVPRKVKATAKGRTVTTKWKAPKTDGGTPVTGYHVQALASSRKGAAVLGSCTAAATKRKCKVSGLKRGRSYWMSVSVTNAEGTTWAPRRKVTVPVPVAVPSASAKR